MTLKTNSLSWCVPSSYPALCSPPYPGSRMSSILPKLRNSTRRLSYLWIPNMWELGKATATRDALDFIMSLGWKIPVNLLPESERLLKSPFLLFSSSLDSFKVSTLSLLNLFWRISVNSVWWAFTQCAYCWFLRSYFTVFWISDLRATFCLYALVPSESHL